mgnify:CR=1 FL=1
MKVVLARLDGETLAIQSSRLELFKQVSTMCTKKKICTSTSKTNRILIEEAVVVITTVAKQARGGREYYLADFDKFAASNAVSAENELEKSRGAGELLQN